LKEELHGPLKEGSTARVIRIENMEARVLKLLGSFIYSDSVPEMEEEEDDVTWQHLLAVADGYISGD
jgi:speckle-type POZ protein